MKRYGRFLYLHFYMIHEVPDQDRYILKELKKMLNPKGKILIIEPIFHVTKHNFHNMIIRLEKVGFKTIERPRLFFS